MFSVLIDVLQALNNPWVLFLFGLGFAGSYYAVSAVFHSKARIKEYQGPWRKNGAIDIVTSVIWSLTAVVLIGGLIDLVSRSQLPLGLLLGYYTLFILLFAFLYNILDWHFPGTIAGLQSGWAGELQCLCMSVQIMTTGDYTSAKPGKLGVECLSAFQTLLGIAFVAVFVAKAVSLLKA